MIKFDKMLKRVREEDVSDDIYEYDTSSSFPATGQISKIYIALDTGIMYIWDGDSYVPQGGSGVVVATGAEVDTGTDNVKVVTPKAMEDSSYIKSTALSSYVPTSRTLTINGTALDLSADRSWTVASGGAYIFPVAGVIGATGTNVSVTHIINGNKTISSVDLRYGVAGSGTLTVDVNKNGTTIFNTTKPSITTTNQYSINSGTLTTTSLASGDILTIDIDGVPTGTKGTDLYVRVNYS